MKIVRAIREGYIIPHKPKGADKPRFYGFWTDDDVPRSDHVMQLPAPKLTLPHDESYNRPAEYLPSDQEQNDWTPRIVQRITCRGSMVSLIRSYTTHRSPHNQFIQKLFDRCLDLYLVPRVRGGLER